MSEAMTPKKRKAAMAVVDDVVASINGIEAPVLRRMIPVLRQAHRELSRDLMAWMNMEDGAKRFTAQKYRNALAQVKRAMATIDELGVESGRALTAEWPQVGALSVRNLELELSQFGRIFDGSIHPIALDTGAVLARGKSTVLQRFKSSARRYAGGIKEDVMQELAVSRIKSETISEAALRLRKRIPLLESKHRMWSERLARTEIMNAYNVGHLSALKDAAKEDDELVMRWDSAADARRCPVCASMDGETAPIGEVFKGGSHGPPIHPNCRCVLTPWKERWGAMTRIAPRSSRIVDVKIAA